MLDLGESVRLYQTPHIFTQKNKLSNRKVLLSPGTNVTKIPRYFTTVVLTPLFLGLKYHSKIPWYLSFLPWAYVIKLFTMVIYWYSMVITKVLQLYNGE
jgi:hypothetical protein